MNREIRYRVWCEYEIPGVVDKVFKQMESDAGWFLLTQTGHLMSHGPMGDFDPNAEKKYRKLVPMLWTGLKDKHGTDIYEGDIIASPHIIEPGAVVQWDERQGSWSLGEAWPFGEFYGGVEGVQQCEVIGNIYENPDLAKAASA